MGQRCWQPMLREKVELSSVAAGTETRSSKEEIAEVRADVPDQPLLTHRRGNVETHEGNEGLRIPQALQILSPVLLTSASPADSLARPLNVCKPCRISRQTS
jgi:hypothetical protein